MRGAMLAVAMICGAGVATAAETTVYNVDLSPTVQILLDYVLAAIGAVIAWAIGKYVAPALGEYLGEHAAQIARDGLDEIARRGIQIAARKLRVQDGQHAFEIENELVAEAAEYINASAPGWKAKFGLDEERIAAMVRARLGEEIARIEAREPWTISEPQG